MDIRSFFGGKEVGSKKPSAERLSVASSPSKNNKKRTATALADNEVVMNNAKKVHQF